MQVFNLASYVVGIVIVWAMLSAFFHRYATVSELCECGCWSLDVDFGYVYIYIHIRMLVVRSRFVYVSHDFRDFIGLNSASA